MGAHGSLPYIPVLRFGQPYRSLDTVVVKSHRDGTPLAEVGQANVGLVRRDLMRAHEAAAVLRAMPVAQLIDICGRAAELFLDGEVESDIDGTLWGPERYVEVLSATSGLPHRMCRANMLKVHEVLSEMPRILGGLTRGLDLGVLDGGALEQNGVPVAYCPNGDSLGVILPSNSPGVNSIWLPSIPLKTPLFLKPGREEPWTPYRILSAFRAAGCPPEALGYYPTSHEGSAAILALAGRSQLFGDARTTDPYKNDPRVELHGPGWSKVLLGPDEAPRYAEHLDVLVDSVAKNGGRSCINASTILTPSHAVEMADAVAQRLARIEPRAPEDPEAELSAFANPAVAAWCDATIEAGLAEGGAEDVTARYRQGPRLVEAFGGTYMRPTLIRCDSLEHPLARTELLFPFASVVQVPEGELVSALGHSLVVSGITREPALQAALHAANHVDRLNLGPLPTSKVEWDQPHEGNLFEFLHTRRAFQSASSWA